MTNTVYKYITEDKVCHNTLPLQYITQLFSSINYSKDKPNDLIGTNIYKCKMRLVLVLNIEAKDYIYILHCLCETTNSTTYRGFSGLTGFRLRRHLWNRVLYF